MKVKISHEVPITLLEESKKFNDYDYCLPHLLDQHNLYEKYFRQSILNDFCTLVAPA